MKKFKSLREETDAQRKAKFASGAAGGPTSSSRKKKMDEAPLVMADMEIIKSILNKIEDDIQKVKVKGQLERVWPKIQALAKMAGYKVTKAGQAKGRTFRFDLKK